MTLTAPLKWHGGKAYLADWILSHAPPRVKNPNAPAADDPGYLHYVEPFAGGLQVLLANDPEGISEVVNDLNGGLINFWRCMASVDGFARMQRAMEATPFAKQIYEEAVRGEIKLRDDPDGDWRQAVAFFVQCRQSLSGRMKSFSGITKTRTRRGMNNEVSAWLSAIEGLPAVHERLKRVLILNDKATHVIESQDGPRTWFYLDPPYLHSTRATPSVYEHEMSEAEHAYLLDLLGGIKGRFALSGYPSRLYEEAAERCGWRCVRKEIANHSSGAKVKRTEVECLWMNY